MATPKFLQGKGDFHIELKKRVNNYFSVEWRLFFVTGLLGGFTTFSSFSIETITLMRTGHNWLALSYIAASVIIGLAATFVGISIFKLF